MHLPAFTGILKQANRSFVASNKPSTHALNLRPFAPGLRLPSLAHTNLHTMSWQNRGHRKMAISTLLHNTPFHHDPFAVWIILGGV